MRPPNQGKASPRQPEPRRQKAGCQQMQPLRDAAISPQGRRTKPQQQPLLKRSRLGCASARTWTRHPSASERPPPPICLSTATHPQTICYLSATYPPRIRHIPATYPPPIRRQCSATHLQQIYNPFATQISATHHPQICEGFATYRSATCPPAVCHPADPPLILPEIRHPSATLPPPMCHPSATQLRFPTLPATLLQPSFSSGVKRNARLKAGRRLQAIVLDPGVEPEASRRRDSPDAAQSVPEDSAERPDERAELLRRRVIQDIN